MSDRKVHHPKVIIAMIEVGEVVSDSDVVRVEAFMRTRPALYPPHVREHIVKLGKLRVESAAELATMKDQQADFEHEAFMKR